MSEFKQLMQKLQGREMQRILRSNEQLNKCSKKIEALLSREGKLEEQYNKRITNLGNKIADKKFTTSNKTLDYIITLRHPLEWWEPLYDRVNLLGKLVQKHKGEEVLIVMRDYGSTPEDISYIYIPNNKGALEFKYRFNVLFISADKACYANPNNEDSSISKWRTSKTVEDRGNYIKLWSFDIRYWEDKENKISPMIKNEFQHKVIFGEKNIDAFVKKNRIKTLVSKLRRQK